MLSVLDEWVLLLLAIFSSPGLNVIVYNRTESETRPLVEAGAVKALSPKEVAMKSDVLVTSLREDQAVLDVVSGEEGILSGLQQQQLQQQPNRIHIGTSTISPALSTSLVKCILLMVAHI